jgi:hypothetical protein
MWLDWVSSSVFSLFLRVFLRRSVLQRRRMTET